MLQGSHLSWAALLAHPDSKNADPDPGPHRYVGFEVLEGVVSSSWEFLNSEIPKLQLQESCWCWAIGVCSVFSGNVLFSALSNHQADLGGAAGQNTIAREVDYFKMNETLLQPPLKKKKKRLFFPISHKIWLFPEQCWNLPDAYEIYCLLSTLLPIGQSARFPNL